MYKRQVPEFSGIQVTYLNGDGTASEWRSNIKDILAMTNVYQYYEPDSGLGELEAYALELWSCLLYTSPCSM